jgi:hypothetical protein
MSRIAGLASLLLCLNILGSGQSPDVQRMEITLEQKSGEKKAATQATEVEPGHVFVTGDRIRFRFTPNFDGYLYVMSRGTSGSYSVLFPGGDTGLDNHIRSAHTYLLPPDGDGWFGVTGPAGHDIVYFVVTPSRLTDGASPPVPALPPAQQSPIVMTPRCNDAIFRARGECVDSTAGPKAVGEQEALPRNLPAGHEASRDLVIIRKDKTAVVSSPAPLSSPAIYEFHVAHK